MMNFYQKLFQFICFQAKMFFDAIHYQQFRFADFRIPVLILNIFIFFFFIYFDFIFVWNYTYIKYFAHHTIKLKIIRDRHFLLLVFIKKWSHNNSFTIFICIYTGLERNTFSLWLLQYLCYIVNAFWNYFM